MRIIVCSLLIVGMSTICAAQTSSVTFRITGIKTSKGKILISIFNTENSFLETPYKSQSVGNLKGSDVVIVFNDLPPGNYASSTFHDVNDNGKLDTNWMGIPIEPYGFSNNARGTFGPASYKTCVFNIKTGDNKHEINLK